IYKVEGVSSMKPSASGGFRYPDDFLNSAKNIFPRASFLHRAIERGEISRVGEMLGALPPTIQAKEVVAALENGETEQLLARARLIAMRPTLFDRWREIVNVHWP